MDFHNLRRRAALAEQARHLTHGLVNVREKGFEARAQVIQPRFTVGREVGAIFGTAAVAGKQDGAFAAITRQGRFFIQSKSALLLAAHQFDHGSFENIAQAVRRLNEMVAGIQVAVMLHCQRQSAGLLENAQAAGRAQPASQRGVEHLHENPAHVAAHPFVENGDEKIAVLFSRDGARRQVVALLEARLVLALDDGNELDELRADLVAQEAVHFQRLMDIGGADAGQDVEIHSMLFE